MPTDVFDAPAICKALEEWFATHARDYPWRRTRDPYAILVSEMMLQQTQIPTVLERGYYQRWMERFPDSATLARAEEAEVLRAWEGLGYYRRARFLHQAARTIEAEHAGAFPTNPTAIRALPGVGRYTAGAVASFAFDAPEPIVDGNIARVLSRLCNDETPVDSPAGLDRLWQRASVLVQAAHSPRCLNSALMELGQTLCRNGAPECGPCPVRSLCRAQDPAQLPAKSRRTTVTEVTERVFFHQDSTGILLQQETGRRRTGLWKLPELPTAEPLPPVLQKAKYAITRYRVTLWVHEAPRATVIAAMLADPAVRSVPLVEVALLPMPAPYRKALNAVLAVNRPEFALSEAICDT
ncbi:MAG: A/G-specific adenine glycosylase [Roseimicrobium sp.]